MRVFSRDSLGSRVRTTPLPDPAGSTPGTFSGVAAATADSVKPSRDRSPGHATTVSVTGTTSGVTEAGPDRSEPKADAATPATVTRRSTTASCAPGRLPSLDEVIPLPRPAGPGQGVPRLRAPALRPADPTAATSEAGSR